MNFLESMQQNISTAILFWIIFIISIIISKQYQKKRLTYNAMGEVAIKHINRISSFFWILSIILLPSLIIGFRHYQVGRDTINYALTYSRMAAGTIPLISSNRILYSFFTYITYLISNGNPTFFLFTLVFLTLYILIKALDKFMDKISLPLALFVYYSLFGMQLLNQSRQLLALSIFFYAIPFLLEHNHIKYYLIIGVASLVHFTALIGVVFHVLYFKKSYYRPIKKLLYNIIWILSPVLMYPGLILLNKLLPSFYQSYIDIVSYNGIGFGLLVAIFPVIIPIILYQKYLKTDESRFMVRIAMLTYPLRYAGYYSYFLMRLNYFSSAFMVLLIPLMISKLKSRSSQIKGKLVMIAIFLIYYVVHYMYLDAGGIFPYRPVF